MKKEKIQDAIKKYKLSLMLKDGEEMIRASKPPKSERIIAGLKMAKSEIITELKRQQAEQDAQDAAREAEYQENQERYVKTADLRRCLLNEVDEYYRQKWSIRTLVFTAENKIFSEESEESILQAFEPEYRRLLEHVSLKHVTPSMKAACKNSVPYGLSGVAYEITPEQEAQIVAEQGPAQEEADRIAAEEKAAKEAAAAEKKARAEAELQAKFAEAKSSGKPVQIRRFAIACCDPHEECDIDIVVEYAMPDGSVRREQHHTW
jgi:IS30 family transposase